MSPHATDPSEAFAVAPQQHSRLLSVTAGLLAVFSVQRFVLFGAKGYLIDVSQDFNSYYLAAKSFLHGSNPYDTEALWRQFGTSEGIFYPFLYPPFSLLLVTGLTVFDAHVAAIIFLLATVMLFGVSIYSFSRIFFDPATARVLAVLGFAFQPVISTVLMGQINLVVLSLVALSVSYADRGKHGRAALCAALGVFTKITPAFLLVYYLLRREYRVAFKTAGWLLVLLLVSVAIFGVDLHREYFTLARRLSAESVPAYENQGLNGFLSRLMVPSYTATPLFANPAAFPRVYRFLTILAFALSALGCVLARSRHVALGIMLSLALLVTPISWYHTFVTLYLVFVIALQRALRSDGGSLENWTLLSCLLFFFHGSTANLGSAIDVTHYNHGLRTLVLSLPFFILVGIWTVLLLIALRPSAPPRN